MKYKALLKSDKILKQGQADFSLRISLKPTFPRLPLSQGNEAHKYQIPQAHLSLDIIGKRFHVEADNKGEIILKYKIEKL